MIRFTHTCFQYADSGDGVEDIGLHVRKGECVVLTGPSGNGKTTLTRLVNGLAPAFYAGRLSGAVELGGRDRREEPLWQRGRLVGSVFQDPKSQFFSSQLAGEVAFACENYGIPHDEIVSRTDAAIRAFRLEGLRDRPLDVLSSGEKQRTAMASVCALDPPVLVCDEPTANLDEQGIRELRDALLQFKREGRTLLIAEHRLAWLAGLADRFVYVREGRLRWEKTPEQMLGMTEEERERLQLRSVREGAPAALPPPTGEGVPAVSLEGLACGRGRKCIWEDLRLAAWPGRVTALTGRNGAGKTTLAKILAGLERPSRGEIRIHGRKASPAQRRKHCWYSANDTGTQFFTNSVSEELLLGLPRTQAVLDRARALLRRFALYAYKDAHPAILSGGQKQRLAIACGLISGREILLLDEPTSGLDGGNMRIIADALRAEADHGKTVLVITHDGELIRACCDSQWKLE